MTRENNRTRFHNPLFPQDKIYKNQEMILKHH
jgi:hypothetical protein